MAGRIKNCLLTLVLVLAAGLPADAATFSMKRGLNLDIWTTWPQEDSWNDPDVILPFPEWRKTLDADGLAALKTAGFDFVRMPVDPAPLLSARSAELRDRLVGSVVESARLVNAAGLKVVVDMHLFPAGGGRSVGMAEVMDDAAMFDRYVELVRTMAAALAKEDPALVAFEPMNEPVVDCDADNTNFWPDRLQRLYAAARASATQADDRAHRRLLFRRRSAGQDRPEGDPRRQRHLDVPLLRSVPADASGRDLGRRLHPVRDGLAVPALCGAARRARRGARDDPPAHPRQGLVVAPARHARLSRRADRDDGHESRTRRDHRAAVRDRGGLGQAERHRSRRTSFWASSA